MCGKWALNIQHWIMKLQNYVLSTHRWISNVSEPKLEHPARNYETSAELNPKTSALKIEYSAQNYETSAELNPKASALKWVESTQSWILLMFQCWVWIFRTEVGRVRTKFSVPRVEFLRFQSWVGSAQNWRLFLISNQLRVFRGLDTLLCWRLTLSYIRCH